MTEGQVTENTDRPSLSEVESVVRELAADHVVSQVDWYSRRKWQPRLAHHSSGVLVILASVMIPVLAQSQFARRDLVLSALGVLVAVLTSLNSFFAWDQVWRSRRQAEGFLERALAKWEIELKRARLGFTEADPREHMFRATEDLLTKASAALEAEESQFFESVHSVEGALPRQAKPTSKDL